MIKKIYLLPLLLFSLVFVACNETEEASKYDNWKVRNEAFIDSLQRVYDAAPNGPLKRIPYSHDKKVGIFYKVKESGPTTTPGNEPINPAYYNSIVRVFYRGILINESVFSDAEPPYYYTDLYAEKDVDVFDQNFTGDVPSEFDSPYKTYVNGNIVAGWTEILQLMRPGDRFEIYLPYQVAYGESGRDGILGYTALIFDIIMLDIDYYPKR